MEHIYIKDADGRKIIVEVTEEVAQAYRESLREEWRGDAKERYHTISLGVIADAGHEFADGDEGIEERLSREADDAVRQEHLEKLSEAVEHLTPLRRATVYKLYVLRMSQREIAIEEDVTEATVSERIANLHNKLKKFLKKV